MTKREAEFTEVGFRDMFQQRNLRGIRLPILIGKYFSSPSDQAEFRANEDAELLKRYGVSNLSFADRILGGEVSDVPSSARQLRV